MSAARHKHEFSAMWWNFGPYGPQDVHVHSCFTDGCDRVVIGDGRDCDVSRGQKHRRMTLTEDGPRVRAAAVQPPEEQPDVQTPHDAEWLEYDDATRPAPEERKR